MIVTRKELHNVGTLEVYQTCHQMATALFTGEKEQTERVRTLGETVRVE